MSKREKLAKLLRLAEGNANEHEANAAIDMLRQRALEYGLTLDDIRSHSEASAQYVTETKYSGKNFNLIDKWLTFDIARFCCVKVNHTTDAEGNKCIVYFGHEADVELAYWLRGTLLRVFNTLWEVERDFMLKDKSDLVNKKISFAKGFTDRMRQRMAEADRKEASTTGTALIVQKNALLDIRAQQLGFEQARGGHGKHHNINGSMYGAGQAAANTVAMGRGVGNGSVKRIGR